MSGGCPLVSNMRTVDGGARVLYIYTYTCLYVHSFYPGHLPRGQCIHFYENLRTTTPRVCCSSTYSPLHPDISFLQNKTKKNILKLTISVEKKKIEEREEEKNQFY